MYFDYNVAVSTAIVISAAGFSLAFFPPKTKENEYDQAILSTAVSQTSFNQATFNNYYKYCHLSTNFNVRTKYVISSGFSRGVVLDAPQELHLLQLKLSKRALWSEAIEGPLLSP